MADADEDAMLRVGTRTQNDAASGMQQDMSDETQDFRFLNALTAFPDPNQATLPKRGEKDFEPNPTELQSNVLAASRQAMHNALSFPRLHNEKTVVTGVFCPTGVLIPREKLEELQRDDEITTHQDEGAAKRKPSPSYGINPDACVSTL
ncbi:tRNA-splicing endonuclease subunit sen54 [Ascosphaera atra]|nr:tRNA-splicing endonuclease subunit sen54 [Ascosphaera atra]